MMASHSSKTFRNPPSRSPEREAGQSSSDTFVRTIGKTYMAKQSKPSPGVSRNNTPTSQPPGWWLKL